MSKKNNTTIKIIMISIITLIIAGLIAYSFFKPRWIKKHLPQPIAINTANQPTLGNREAKIHFVVFEDLKCSNCARFDVEMMPYIKTQYIETGLATYTMINLAFVPGSLPAAIAARCVYQQNHTLFFDYIDYLFKHQPPEDQDWATIPTLMIDAGKIKGIDTDALSLCLIKNPYSDFFDNNLKIASQAMGDQVATPTLYINGIKVDPLTKKQINTIIEAIQ